MVQEHGPLCQGLAEKGEVLALLEDLAALVAVVRPHPDLLRAGVVVVGSETVEGWHTSSISATPKRAGAAARAAKLTPSK